MNKTNTHTLQLNGLPLTEQEEAQLAEFCSKTGDLLTGTLTKSRYPDGPGLHWLYTPREDVGGTTSQAGALAEFLNSLMTNGVHTAKPRAPEPQPR